MNKGEKQSQQVAIVQEELDEGFDILDYVCVILKYRKMIFLICTFAVVTTGIICLTSPKIYSAKTSIVSPEESLGPSGLVKELPSGLGSIIGGALRVENMVDRYRGILESRVVADAVIDKFSLMEVYDVDKRFIARKILEKNTTIKSSKEGIVKITVKDRDPNRAAAIANTYVEELDRQNKRLSSAQATNKREFIENRLNEINEDLRDIENIPSMKASVLEILHKMLSQEYELAKIEEAKSMPTIQVLDTAIVPEVRMARGTVKKTFLAGVFSLIFATLIAFAREYVANIKGGKSEERWDFWFKSKQQSNKGGTFNEVESQRQIIAKQRRKRAHNSSSNAEGSIERDGIKAVNKVEKHPAGDGVVRK